MVELPGPPTHWRPPEVVLTAHVVAELPLPNTFVANCGYPPKTVPSPEEATIVDPPVPPTKLNSPAPALNHDELVAAVTEVNPTLAAIVSLVPLSVTDRAPSPPAT